MQLIPGRKYIRRDGAVVPIVPNYLSSAYYRTHPLRNPETGHTYKLSGQYDALHPEHYLDIVALCPVNIYTHLPKANR